MSRWEPGAGVITFPSGRTVRGRSLRTDLADHPEAGLYLAGRQPSRRRALGWTWDWEWLRWRDFGRPKDAAQACRVIVAFWQRAARERVEVGCAGGKGRTGTVLACWAVLDGLDPEPAIAYVRAHHHPRAVETTGQRTFVAELAEHARGNS